MNFNSNLIQPNNNYLDFIKSQRKKLVIISLLVILFIVALFSSTLEATISNQQKPINELSTGEILEIGKSVVNIWTVLICFLFIFCLIIFSKKKIKLYIDTITKTSSQNNQESSKENISLWSKKLLVIEAKKINDTSLPISGPLLIRSGMNKIIIIRNNNGYFQILTPSSPKEFDLYFINRNQQIDQILDLDEKTLVFDIESRTKDGISIYFPKIEITFQPDVLKFTLNNNSSLENNSIDIKNIQQVLLKKGTVNLEDIIQYNTIALLFKRIADYTLNDLLILNSTNNSVPRQSNNKEIEGINLLRYKLSTLKKNWIINKHPALYSRYKSKKISVIARNHKKKFHKISTGNKIFINNISNRQFSPDTSIDKFKEKFTSQLSQYFKQYHIQITRFELNNFQLRGSVINDKLSNSRLKIKQVSDLKESFDAREIIRNSKKKTLQNLQILTSKNSVNSAKSSTDLFYANSISRQQMINDINNTAARYGISIPAWFEDQMN